jgi:hypothetical protein
LSKIAILQSNYIPWKGYFDLINSVDIFVIYDEVQFTKNDWRNRNLIKGKEGLQWLTIPVIQNNLSQKIDETEIAHNHWVRKHVQAIQLNYKKSPFFDEVFPFIESLYQFNSSSLSSINQNIIFKINDLLDIKTQIINSKVLELKGDRVYRLIDACKKLKASVYVSGPRAKAYLIDSQFSDEKIQVEWKDYSNYSEYSQIHPPFSHNVSIIDTLMNLGMEETKRYIRNGCRFNT